MLKREAIPAARLVHGAMERLRPQTERARVRLVADFGEDLPAVLADRGRIEQVLLNLIHNATKFTPARRHDHGHGRAVRGIMQINVTDTGVGIPRVGPAARLRALFQIG